MSSRLERRFAALKEQDRPGLVIFITAGDPDRATSQAVLDGLPAAGADVIELGMPFSDPMADGPAIQLASQRALKAGGSMKQTLSMLSEFRKKDAETPIVLMGYYNPIYAYGVDKFVADAAQAGADGLIVVDLPAEEAAELADPAAKAGIAFIRLATPVTGDERMPYLLNGAEGFVYYVSIAGITGAASAAEAEIITAIARIRKHVKLPVAVGFGISTPAQAAAIGRHADAVVVGSAVVRRIEKNLDANGKPNSALVSETLSFVSDLAREIAL
jgi:tryptophan synthase alpha chain